MKKHITVAITGGIGSGKSFLLDILKEKGFSTLSCDKIAREIFEIRKIKKALKTLFPSAVSGKIFLSVDRKKLSEIVFSDRHELDKLNALTHPVIIEETIKRAKKMHSPVFVEVPLLFEGGYQNLFDKIIVVTRSKTTRIKSVIERTGMNENDVLLRMKNQVDYDNMDLSPYVVINNDQTKQHLEKELYSLIQNLFK